MGPLDLLGDPAWRSLTWTLLHFVWQGMLVAAVWAVLFRLLPARRTQTHYLLGLAGMVVLAACPVVTFVVLESQTGRPAGRQTATPPTAETVSLPVSAESAPDAPDPLSAASPPALGTVAAGWRDALAGRVDDVQPYLLGGWVLGLALFSGRLLLGALGAQQLRWSRRRLPDDWARRAAALAGKLGFRGAPRVFLSPAAREALVVGLLRPMVLLPVAWLAEMTPEVLEAVLAHELAHVRRHDLWINLFQRLVETLLFYHPTVWWLSRRVRVAREMCCDELAARATGDRVAYATALELAARKRLPAKSLLEVAWGVTQMTLLDRVRNVLGLAAGRRQGRWWPAAVVALLVPPALWLATLPTTSAQEEKNPPAKEEAQAEQAATSPVAVPPQRGPDGKYTATALLQVAMPERGLPSGSADSLRQEFEMYRNTQAELLRNPYVLVAALQKPEIANLTIVRREKPNEIAWLQNHLKTSFPGNAEIMQVSLTADDPKETATLLGAVVDAYLGEIVGREQAKRRDRFDKVSEVYREKEDETRKKRAALVRLSEQLGVSNAEMLALKQRISVEELSDYRREMLRGRSKVSELQAELAGEEAMLKSAASVGPNDPEVQEAIDEDPAAREYSGALIAWKEKAKSIEAEKEIAELQKRLDARRAELLAIVRNKKMTPVEAEMQRLRATLAVVAQQQEELKHEALAKQKEIERLSKSYVDVEMARAEVKRLEDSLSRLHQEKDALEAELRARPRVRLLEAPLPPPRPDRPAAPAATPAPAKP